jgi:hypothetical protein
MRDIDYFYERDLNRTNIVYFYNSLPSHLQSRFKEGGNAEIILGNVLQGYRGPSNLCNRGSGDSGALESSYGVQEIKFWWGTSKCLNILPVSGSVVFFAIRIVQKCKGELDWSSLYFDSKTGECLSHDKDEASEKLNNKGCQLFQEGKYVEAAEYHNNAYQFCSSRYCNEQAFRNNRDKAKTEVDAINLNSQGDNLFNQGRYNEAQSKYQEAYNKSTVATNKATYDACKSKAKVELDAIGLKELGDKEFNSGRYDSAKVKYQQACDKSSVTANKTTYVTCINKTKTELEAMKLNSEGDQLFEQEDYKESLDKYQSAYNKSKITKEKNIYAINKDKAQTIINKLSILDTLWSKAWDAENDTENDRSGEAKEILQRVLSESKDSLKKFPDNLRFKHYETLVSLKIEGNELFNQGLESQQNGIELLQAAQELKQQQEYELANIKFKDAKGKFSDAQEKFKIGRENDQRFSSCIEFVQEQLHEVIQSIEITEPHMLNQGFNDLNINISNDNLDTDVYESNIMVTGEQHNYYEQI